jgi:hypothetical protein
MTRKNSTILTIVIAILVAVYWNLYRDAFRKHDIQISYTVRSRNGDTGGRMARGATAMNTMPMVTLNFGLDEKYQLTRVKVVTESEFSKNKYAHALWEMVSKSNSPPLMAFVYGDRIWGMHPAVPSAEPEALQEGVPYHIFVEAGKLQGDRVFTVGGSPANSDTNTPPPAQN